MIEIYSFDEMIYLNYKYQFVDYLILLMVKIHVEKILLFVHLIVDDDDDDDDVDYLQI